MLARSLRLIEVNQSKWGELGLDGSALQVLITSRIEQLSKRRIPYEDLNLPIADPHLLLICQTRCKSLDLEWGNKHANTRRFLIHKHTLRDRSAVIKERLRQKKLRYSISY